MFQTRVVIGYSATDLIFPFSENGPANYNFSLFSKLPTNYPKNPKIFKKQSKIRGDPRIFGKNRLFFLNIFSFGGNLLVTLKKVKNCNLQANFQKMEKSDLCLSKLFQAWLPFGEKEIRKSSNDRKFANIARILKIFGRKRSRRRELFFDHFSTE